MPLASATIGSDKQAAIGLPELSAELMPGVGLSPGQWLSEGLSGVAAPFDGELHAMAVEAEANTTGAVGIVKNDIAQPNHTLQLISHSSASIAFSSPLQVLAGDVIKFVTVTGALLAGSLVKAHLRAL